MTTIQERGFPIIKKAQECLSRLPKRKVSPETAAEYQRTYERLSRENMAPEQGTKSKNTYFKRRAAVTYVVQSQLADLLNRQAKEAKAGDLDAWKQSVLRIQRGLAILDRYPPQQFEKQGIVEGRKCPVQNPVKKKSKRQALRGLDTDWREQMFEKAYSMNSSNQDYLAALAVLDLTGARPKEIKEGVQVRIDVSQSKVCCLLKGAKRGMEGRKGQEWRSLCWRYDLGDGTPDNPSPAMYLAAIAHNSGGEVMVSVKNSSCFGDWIRNLGKRIWPKKRNKISPYVYRHQIAADMKKNGDDWGRIAAALGHSVDHTQKHYGMAQQGSGRRSPDDVSCSQAVRKKGGQAVQGLR